MHLRPRSIAAVALVLCAPALLATAPSRSPVAPASAPSVARDTTPVLVSHGSRLAQPAGGGLAKAPGDSFVLFGGPGSLEGKFETAAGEPDRQGWIGVDLTEIPTKWQVSSFNAENLNANGPGNHAMWCGRTAEQEPGWATPPGYGNAWFEVLLFESAPLVDPSIAQTVELDFFFNHETEPGYDFFEVQFDSAGLWRPVLVADGTNREMDQSFPVPGLRASEHSTWRPIVYAGNDYGWSGGPQRVRLRLVVRSDGGWSDEDGAFETVAGAAQVDDIRVRFDDGTGHLVEIFEDFEGAGPFAWMPEQALFVGDFSKVFSRFEDIDPCRENRTPVMTFIDDGTPPSNAPAPDGTTSTGGETSSTWSYGVPGGWVVNRSGGLSGGYVYLDNQIWSPPIAWDLAGPDDDGAEVVGAELRFDVWAHLPLNNGFFWLWHVRSSSDGGSTWSDWRSRDFVYGGGGPVWGSTRFDVTDLLSTGLTHVQVALGVREYDPFFGGLDSTPAPVFDNVSLRKYHVGGPVISLREWDLAQDGFPPAGTIDASTAGARDALDVPFDAARDVGPGGPEVAPGDSVAFEVQSRIPGATVADVRMVWRLDKNPFFEDALRSAPARAGIDENVDTSDPAVWSGEVIAQPGSSPDRWFVDLPDADFLYPGDSLHYYLRATDSDGRVSTLPDDVTSFGDPWRYDRRFVIRGLPTIVDAAGSHPPLLWINLQGHGPAEERMHRAFAELGFLEGEHFDSFDVRAPDFRASNGIGSAGGHGATAQQLAGYAGIVLDAGDLYQGVLSEDLGVLRAWHELPGARSLLSFGDDIASGAQSESAAGASYVEEILGISVLGADVSPALGGRVSAGVMPVDPSFATSFDAVGGCPVLNRFDHIVPAGTAVASHRFVDAAGAVVAGAAAGVIHDRMVEGHRKVDLTYPFGSQFVYEQPSKSSGGAIVLTNLLREALDYFLLPSTGGDTASPLPASRLALAAAPNPSNPSTVISYSVPVDGRVRLRLYDLRGALVRTLLETMVESGTHTVRWNGRDDRGARVASGVYLLEMRTEAGSVTEKVALLK